MQHAAAATKHHNTTNDATANDTHRWTADEDACYLVAAVEFFTKGETFGLKLPHLVSGRISQCFSKMALSVLDPKAAVSHGPTHG
jgi:hypothetical protein